MVKSIKSFGVNVSNSLEEVVSTSNAASSKPSVDEGKLLSPFLFSLFS
jgi:hypothetical protein